MGEKFGGETATGGTIENYPGYPSRVFRGTHFATEHARPVGKTSTVPVQCTPSNGLRAEAFLTYRRGVTPCFLVFSCGVRQCEG